MSIIEVVLLRHDSLGVQFAERRATAFAVNKHAKELEGKLGHQPPVSVSSGLGIRGLNGLRLGFERH